uniref:Integrase core domain containing protein n=1 Tax=Solanum tuberosum TaxID=4113 RepID=M1DFN7_SOLTU
MAGSEKVNVVGTPNRYEDQDIDLDEESKYLGNQRGFRNYNSRNQGYNSANAGTEHAQGLERTGREEVESEQERFGLRIAELVQETLHGQSHGTWCPSRATSRFVTSTYLIWELLESGSQKGSRSVRLCTDCLASREPQVSFTLSSHVHGPWCPSRATSQSVVLNPESLKPDPTRAF